MGRFVSQLMYRRVMVGNDIFERTGGMMVSFVFRSSLWSAYTGEVLKVGVYLNTLSNAQFCDNAKWSTSTRALFRGKTEINTKQVGVKRITPRHTMLLPMETS